MIYLRDWSKKEKDMEGAYSKVMENVVEDFSVKKDINVKEKNKEVIIDKEYVSIKEELDSTSDDLDDLLK